MNRGLAGVAALLLAFGVVAGCSTSYEDPSDSGPSNFYGGDGDDLDCSDVGGPVNVGGNDPNNLDADNDGVGCEGG